MKGITSYIEASLSGFGADRYSSPPISRLEASSVFSDESKAHFEKLSAGILVAGTGPAGLVNAIRTKPDFSENQAQSQKLAPDPTSTQADTSKLSSATDLSPLTLQPVLLGPSAQGLRARIEYSTLAQAGQRVSVDA